MSFKDIVEKARVKAIAFLATPFGHAAEHAVTAAAATAAGLLVSKYLKHQPITLEDAKAAIALFVSGAFFGLRTAVREYLKPSDDPTKLKSKTTQRAIVAANKRKHR